jgi:hypothetical protein
MLKEKRKKSPRIYVPSPEGARPLYFGPTEERNNEWPLGIINIIEVDDAEPRYIGAIQFSEDVKTVSNKPYPLHIEFDLDSGEIHFHIQGATKEFDNTTPIPPADHFMFDGICALDQQGNVALSGTAGVPPGFIPENGKSGKAKSDPPTDPGEPVTWTSEGPGTTHPKHSK